MTETARQISAIDIKRLWHTTTLEDAPTIDSIADVVKGAEEIKNVHQDTWQIEEAESSQDTYKNQLTGATYRVGAKSMGEVAFNFTIGRYDFDLKAKLMGGTTSEGGKSWSRQRGITDIKKCMIALTEDDVLCVLPYSNVNARESNTDGAVGIAVVATMLEPEVESIMPEYWFDAQGMTLD